MLESHKKEIAAARPSNVARFITSFIILAVGFFNHVNAFYYIFAIHLLAGIIWWIFYETKYELYLKYPQFWFYTCSLDIFLVSSLVYASGTSYSPAIIGYVIITALSSMDSLESRGVFAAIGGFIAFFLLSWLVYFGILDFVNVINKDISWNLNLFTLLLSNCLLLLGVYSVNRVIYKIYVQLQEKNIALQSTLNEVSKLKFQQDGDYFLTSLLIEPFQAKKVVSEKFLIETVISQYKKFHFKNHDSELGGDILIVEELLIEDSKYIVFINGDAMGKSMQGAGGALVLCSVFKSILSRCDRILKSEFDPIVFLKNTYSELQNVFESFDGLMMVSMIFGIIEEQTGVMHYFNAEHPFLILFRDGKANFLDEKIAIRKIGTPSFLQYNLEIESFTLFPGDQIFIGSDGKDDLFLKEKKFIDTDENRFLRILEKTNGNIQESIELLKKEGEIADDLTVLKIMCIQPIGEIL